MISTSAASVKQPEAVLNGKAGGCSLQRLVLRLFGFRPIEPHNMDDGWRLYVDGKGKLCALNKKEFTGWYIVTDAKGRPFMAQNAPHEPPRTTDEQ